MKPLHYISIVLLLLLAACGTTRKSETIRVEKSADTLKTQVAQQSKDSIRHTTNTTVKDSAVGVSGKKVQDIIRKEDTEIPTTKAGKKVPRHFSKKDNGLEAWVNIDTNGNVQYGANADSFTLVIKNLIERNDSLLQVKSNNKSDSTYQAHHEAIQEQTFIKKVRAFMAGFGWLFLVVAFMGGCVVGWYIKKILS